MTDFAANSYASGDAFKAFCPSGQVAISGGYLFIDDPVGGLPNDQFWFMTGGLRRRSTTG